MHALTLIVGLLHARLLVIGLGATGDAVTNITGALLHLLLSGLGGVGSELLLGLCREELARYPMQHYMHINVLVLQSLRPASDIFASGLVKC